MSFVLVFLVTFAVVATIGAIREIGSPDPVAARAADIRSGRADGGFIGLPAPADPPADRRVAGHLSGGAAWIIGRLEQAMGRQGRSRRLEARLRQAGMRLRAAEFYALRTAVGLAAGLLAGVAIGGLGWFLLVGIGAFLLPDLLVERAVQKRHRAFAVHLSDALTAIANSLRSGFSFLQAVDVAAGELPEPIASELAQVVKETQVDIPMEDALANLYARVPLPEVQLAVTAVLIQRQVGGNLAGLLDQVGETVRTRFRIEREMRALTAQGRLSGWIIGLMPAALGGLIFLINRDYVRMLFTDVLGQAMLVAAGVLQVIGVLVIRRMVRLEV